MVPAPAAAPPPEGLTLPLTPGQRLRRLLRLQAFYAFASTLHWTLGYFFLIQELAFPIPWVILVGGLFYVTGAVILLVIPAFESRWALRLGFLLRVLTILPYWLWPTLPGILLASIFFGLSITIFWVPYNLIFFEHRARTSNAGISAVYAMVQPVLDVVAALLAGWIVLRWGFDSLFAIAFVAGFLAWPATFRLRPRAPIRVELFARLARLARLRLLVFLDGMAQGTVWLAVPIVTITLFLSEAFQYALFFAFLGAVAAVGALLVGRLSDKRAKRFAFIWPAALLLAVANALSAFAFTVVQWGLLRALIMLSGIVLEPFRNAVLLDAAATTEDLYVAREFLLNSGRVGGAGLVALFYAAGQLQLVFLAAAALALAFPIIIAARDLYPEERLLMKPFRGIFRQ